jgi:hypothetical protein
MPQDAYKVEGYGTRNPEYDGPYLDGSDFDPAVRFAFGGDPEKQAQLQEVLDEYEGLAVVTSNGVSIITASDEPNVLVVLKEPEDTTVVVLDRSRLDELTEEQAQSEADFEDENPEADTAEDSEEDKNSHPSGSSNVTLS